MSAVLSTSRTTLMPQQTPAESIDEPVGCWSLLLSGGFVAPGAMPAIPAGVLSEDVLVRYEHPQLLSKKEVRRHPAAQTAAFRCVLELGGLLGWAGAGRAERARAVAGRRLTGAFVWAQQYTARKGLARRGTAAEVDDEREETRYAPAHNGL